MTSFYILVRRIIPSFLPLLFIPLTPDLFITPGTPIKAIASAHHRGCPASVSSAPATSLTKYSVASEPLAHTFGVIACAYDGLVVRADFCFDLHWFFVALSCHLESGSSDVRHVLLCP